MILVDNIVFMKDRFPLVWEAYRAAEAKQDEHLLETILTRVDNCPTLFVHRESGSYYLHSRYDPRREAQTVIDNIDASGYDHVIFYGLGLGYHLQAFLEKHPQISFSIYEPVPEIFKAYLSHFDLRDLPQRRLHEIAVETSPQDAQAFLQRIVAQIQNKILFVDLPSYRNAFPEKHNVFLKQFQETVSNRRTNLATDVAFEKRWIVNSLLNFKAVLNTPNILVERAGHFKNQPAILVAAGPSLDYELENLKHIKENGQAYIFTVGSAVNSLLSAGIRPDAQCTYDPGADNQGMVFARITKEGINDIPLIFGSSVGYEVLQNYPGQNKLHMITSQDTISSYLLKLDNENQLDGVMDAPTIAIVTLQLLYKLGFNPIILVGQNLAYADNNYYAGGIEYGDKFRLTQTDGLICVKDVEGKEVYTSLVFDRMRANMEQFIQHMTDVNIINTTRGGAAIKGTTYHTLDELMTSGVLSSNVVEQEWYNIPPTVYDRDYLCRYFNRLEKDYQQLPVLLEQVNRTLEEIRILKEDRNYEQINRCWPKLDRVFNKVKKNLFYKQVIHPMNRVTYNLYFGKLPTVRFEPNQGLKADVIIASLGRAVYDSMVDMQALKPLMNDLSQCIR